MANPVLAMLVFSGMLSAQSGGAPSARAKTLPPVKSVPGDLDTDRPDFTEVAGVVGKGVVQIEAGFTTEHSQGGSLSVPEPLVRIGVSKRLELRVGGDGYVAERAAEGVTVRGHSDVEIGMKIMAVEETRHRPAISLIPLLSLPLGSSDFSSSAHDPTLKVVWSKDLIRGFSLGGNVNFSSLSAPDGRFFQTAYSASLAHELRYGFGGYWEIFGFTPWEKGGSAAWIADTGVTRSIGKNAQADFRVGRRLTSSGPDWYWGVGIAYRHVPGKH